MVAARPQCFGLWLALLTPTAGSLSLDDESLSFKRGSLEIVPWNDRLLPWRRVLENFTVILEGRGVPKGEARKRAERQFAAVSLGNAFRKYPHDLLGAE